MRAWRTGTNGASRLRLVEQYRDHVAPTCPDF